MAERLAEMDDNEFYYSPEERKLLGQEPTIMEAVYRPADAFLMLRLSDGHRLLIPREELGELKNATDEQAMEIKIVPTGTAIWWPQIDDGLYLPDFLERRWGKVSRGVAA